MATWQDVQKLMDASASKLFDDLQAIGIHTPGIVLVVERHLQGDEYEGHLSLNADDDEDAVGMMERALQITRAYGVTDEPEPPVTGVH